MKLQSNVVITRSNLSLYCIQHCDYSSKACIRLETHNRHPIPRPNGRVFVVKVPENIDRIATAPHCIFAVWILLPCVWCISTNKAGTISSHLLNSQNTSALFGLMGSCRVGVIFDGSEVHKTTQIAKFMGPIMGPTCRPKMGSMLAPRNLLSRYIHRLTFVVFYCSLEAVSV